MLQKAIRNQMSSNLVLSVTKVKVSIDLSLAKVYLSIFPKEIVPTPRHWAEKRFSNIRYWNDLDKGGHFAAFEQPEIFVNELRSWNRSLG